MDQLRRVGALLKKPIPKTIQNAIAVTKLLDEKYLWVDTLCIVQDDGPEKHAEMSKMGAIFANSAVTIIAAQGKHANSGLRGFRGVSEARNLKQNVHCLAGEARVVLFPMGPSLSERGAHDTKWRTRGWTYQEHFFSRKRLIFDGDSVRWECAGAIWREHVEAYLHLEPQFKGAFLCEELFAPSVPDLNWLYWILRVYNKRSFTYPEDALYAFDGIALLASQPLVGGFVSGLPMAFFEIALLWQPEGKITRRVPRCPEKPCCLPSWSWAGWSGAIHFDRTSSTDFIRDTKRGLTAPYERRVESILSWKYHETAGVPGKPICASILATKEMWLKNQMEYSSLGWTKHLTTESLKKSYQSPDPRAPSKYFYKNKAYPGEEFWYPIPLARQVSPTPSIFAPYISCTTRRAWLFPDEEPPGKYGDGPILSLRVDGKMWAGIIQPHDGLDSSGETLQDLTNAIELVEIARGGCSETPDEYSSNIEEIMHPERPKKGQWYEYYWVMWVGWIDGIAYRKGLGRVQRQIWEEQRGEPFDLMLG
jgi:hypothetical protein